MHNIALVTIVNGRQDLCDNLGSILLIKVLLFCDAVKQLTSLAKLCDQEIAFVVLEKLIKFENIGVIQLLQNVYFAHEFQFVLVSQAFLVDYLNSSEHLGVSMQALANFAKGSYKVQVRQSWI